MPDGNLRWVSRTPHEIDMECKHEQMQINYYFQQWKIFRSSVAIDLEKSVGFK